MPVVFTAPITRPSHDRSRRMKAAHAVSAPSRDTFDMASALRSSMVGARAFMSVPFDAGGEAAPRRIVGMDRVDARIAEQLADAGVCLAWLRQNSLSHHSVRVEPAQGQHALFKHGRNPVDIFGRLLIRFGYEDGVAGAIRVRDVMTDVVEQQHR